MVYYGMFGRKITRYTVIYGVLGNPKDVRLKGDTPFCLSHKFFRACAARLAALLLQTDGARHPTKNSTSAQHTCVRALAWFIIHASL